MMKFTRRAAIASFAAFGLAASDLPAAAQDKMTFTMATSGTETDQRSVAMAEVFAPMSQALPITSQAITARSLPRAPNWKPSPAVI